MTIQSAAVNADKPLFWDEASAHLMKRDRILRKLIPGLNSEWLLPTATPFITLARAIVGQQVSVKAADSVWARVLEQCGRRPTPATMLQTDAQLLREAGLSKRKTEYIHDLARHFAEKKIRPAAWNDMDDEAVVAELCAIRGIGRWTAEMFLIFNLQRPDVLPLDDVGLLKAISLHYFSGEPVSRFEAREVAQAWAPWRTVATWYLWRSLDAAAIRA
ncbi:DNA-3-methyladenine glycosylase [Candidimonas nitroreducens]|uniref:DNA-3-methyladenine glycosylase II n=1 Tax=Candidimonas nitroreducens TaxID=683354 RepID=A0A225MG05_9BURK|nr:DNA-3-methyladenine glycosylase [Candidimonas nitroreducens]OWT60118.1 DNA-3-methyladenine glycosylase [Candidimonas nitroreducens]